MVLGFRRVLSNRGCFYFVLAVLVTNVERIPCTCIYFNGSHFCMLLGFRAVLLDRGISHLAW